MENKKTLEDLQDYAWNVIDGSSKEDGIDLEINFQLSDVKDVTFNELTKKLMKLAKSIATQYQISEYFCGIEPAYEMETRLFTNDQLGDFSIEIREKKGLKNRKSKNGGFSSASLLFRNGHVITVIPGG